MSEEEFVEYEDVVHDVLEGILAQLRWIHNLEKGLDDKTPCSRVSTRFTKYSNTGL